MFVLLLMVLSSLVTISLSQSQSEYPAWPATCSFKRYDDKIPRAAWYTSSTGISTQDLCEAECEGDPHCGMYSWRTSGGWCDRFQMSEMMWGEVEGLNVDEMWRSHSSYRSGTKQCKGEYLPTTCNEYEYRDQKEPSSGIITHVATPSSSLTTDHCKHLCDLYSECESVKYEGSSFYTECHLYKTSLADGMGECSSGFSMCGTYERRCASTTSPPPTADCPDSFYDYHGSTLCLPPDHTQKECEAISGCCYLVMGPIALCLRPVSKPIM